MEERACIAHLAQTAQHAYRCSTYVAMAHNQCVKFLCASADWLGSLGSCHLTASSSEPVLAMVTALANLRQHKVMNGGEITFASRLHHLHKLDLACVQEHLGRS